MRNIRVTGMEITDVDKLMMIQAITDGEISYGKYNKFAETALAKYEEQTFAFLVNSGSSANLLAFMAFTSPLMYPEYRIKSGDEIITVATAFPTTITPIILAGCVPVFIDINEWFNIDVDMLEKAYSPKTKGIFIAHTLGIPYDIDAVQDFCKRHNLFLISDCCDALGSVYKDTKVTNKKFAQVVTNSFYPAHHMSCSFDTIIPYRNENNEHNFDTIETIYNKYKDDPSNIKILSFDRGTKEVNWVNPSAIVQHELKNKSMYRVTTQHGRQVDVTEDHSVFILDENLDIVEKQTKDLTTDDFIVVSNSLPIENKIVEIDLIKEALELDNKIFFISNFSQKVIDGIPNRDYASQWKIRNSMPIEYCRNNYNEDELSKLTIGISQSNKIPAKFIINSDIARLMGYYLAEGSYCQETSLCIALHENETNIVEDIENTCKKYFNTTIFVTHNGNSKGITVGIPSANLVWLFKYVLKIESGAKNKRIPKVLFDCNEEVIKSFVFAYTSGDGSNRELVDNFNTIDVTSVNKLMLNDLQYLLSRMNISGCFYRRNKKRDSHFISGKETSSNENWTLRFSGYKYDLENKTIVKANGTDKNNFCEQIPLVPLIKEWIKGCPISSKNTIICKSRLFKILKEKGIDIPDSLNSDLSFLKVRSIEKIEYSNPYVYDFSVPYNENFYGGFMGIFLHNTSGEGGAVLTSDPLIAKIIQSLRDWGRSCACDPGKDNKCGRRFDGQYGDLPDGYDHKYVYSHLGFNLKMTNPQAALLFSQLKRIDEYTDRRIRNFDTLHEELYPWAFPYKLYDGTWTDFEAYPDSGTIPSWFGYPITLPKHVDRKKIMTKLNSQGVATRLLFSGNILRQPAWQPEYEYRIVGDLAMSNYITEHMFWIGCWHGLTDEDILYEREVVKQAITEAL